VQDRPAHPASLPAPHVPDGRTVCQPTTHYQGQTVSGPATPEIFIPVTNAIESINARYRRAINARGHFPTEQAALKCLYLAIMSLDPTGKGRKRWTNRWKAALNAFDITFDGRLSAGRK
jgi:transposase-like protein